MLCSYYQAGSCRSCSQIEQPYAIQLKAKEQHCREALQAFADVTWLPPVASRETGFRNKAKMVVSGSVDQPLLGILGSTGHGVDLSDCPLYPAVLSAAFATIAAWITQADITPYDLVTRRGELKYILLTLAQHSGELMLRFVLRSQEAEARMRKHFPALQATLPQLRVVSINLQPEHKAIFEGEREILLTSHAHLTMQLNGLPLHLRPQSFFQTNDAVAAQLYAQARDWSDELAPASVWDLFCGVGGFALHCADSMRHVTGIETSAEAIISAERSRDELGLQNVQFRALDATDFVRGNQTAPELVIVNPPRRGIGKSLCEWIDASGAKSLIYSSCNVESLARDLAQMQGFKLVRARVLDMFPHTKHYEIITLLKRHTNPNPRQPSSVIAK
ncbi:23S rRNA (uracil(747)-C(5))-methyltransferase RlmC [Pseudolysobacter antarcticus]|uniref:23S rRNA (uracil(747)-C(5))-methyltransferase RlmC n=1 Tax=Pseudolysobacter antarcticus TaxID=2511995 RepID=A0A411HJT0_9GAMM|nr:23S rRNA (uracil(747)-C(5))-methyltransferase RlmC [Pseudolysobacter antarcticus]QBB70792.1 23S rRNA (uracil(747)-C(5))-methyltransferase RlmC [Pseudolysobacter antarcticus]